MMLQNTRETDFQLHCRLVPIADAIMARLKALGDIPNDELIVLREIDPVLPVIGIIFLSDEEAEVELVADPSVQWVLRCPRFDPTFEVLYTQACLHRELVRILWDRYHRTERSSNYETLSKRRCVRYYNESTTLDCHFHQVVMRILISDPDALATGPGWMWYFGLKRVLDGFQLSYISTDKFSMRSRWFWEEHSARLAAQRGEDSIPFGDIRG